jgi:hypothetical protein
MEQKPRGGCPDGSEEVTDDPDLHWEGNADGLCFYADANVPGDIIEEIRANDIPVIYAQEEGGGRWLDEQVQAGAHELGCVVLTFDRDFWQDGKHPLSPLGGISFVSVPNNRKEGVVDARAAFYWEFAQYWPAD